jgi:AcrR family transcriptional regulator
MTDPSPGTRERILRAAGEHFLRDGIRKTSIADVARGAGVSRITVYRHFPNKEGLAREAFILGEGAFERGLEVLRSRRDAEPEHVLQVIGQGLAALPAGDVGARFDELRRLYPEAYRSVQAVRVRVLDELFAGLFRTARRQRRLRPGLDQQVVEALFSEVVLGFFEKPAFARLGLSIFELYNAVTGILLYGMFTPASKRKRRS